MSSSPASNTETTMVSDSPNLLNVNMANVTKLTASNFLMCSRQVHALINGYDLTGYLDGIVMIVPPTVTTKLTYSLKNIYACTQYESTT